ncbi:hypothetical protein Scep_004495 [Stephania cephalantha]|uniref:Uncharacterized protein n=1 Tax=Stephania cephalantha TaxID=152367 RepID=A0AAP0KSS1_9MAGN
MPIVTSMTVLFLNCKTHNWLVPPSTLPSFPPFIASHEHLPSQQPTTHFPPQPSCPTSLPLVSPSHTTTNPSTENISSPPILQYSNFHPPYSFKGYFQANPQISYPNSNLQTLTSQKMTRTKQVACKFTGTEVDADDGRREEAAQEQAGDGGRATGSGEGVPGRTV